MLRSWRHWGALVFLVGSGLSGRVAFAEDADASTALAPTGMDAGVESAHPPAAIDVTVRADSRAERTRQSAEAVTVIDLAQARRQAADVGEVMARTEGINVRRLGGLGSDARFTLNGLTDDQIRFFVDDVPIELSGYVQGFGNLPWLLLDHVVVYRGVVPIRFGADALGGAVNLITRQPTRGFGGEASYQVGSFGTHRATLSAFQVHKPTGLYGRVSLFLDAARNDYRIDDVIVANADGQITTRDVDAFHNDYRAYGGALELGVVKKPWAERLVLRAFAMRLTRALQTNLIQSAPYGEAAYDRESVGATLRYQQPLTDAWRLEALAGYSYAPTHFTDDATVIYDWLGGRIGPAPTPGETATRPIRQTFWQHNSFARAQLTWKLRPGHDLQLAFMPTHVLRTGEDHLRSEGRDPLAERQQLLSIVGGLAYQLNVLDDRIDNSLFAKSYVYRTRANGTAPNGTLIEEDRSLARVGVGNALRVRLTDGLYAKASYELATRLPRPDEVFGDGVLINSNLSLKEESSHNGNLELTLRQQTERAGELRASVNGFLRKIRDQIVLIAVARDARYQNVYAARSRGVEASAGWTSPGHYLALDGNLTYVDLRNISDQGTFGRNEGDRIPNRPYLFANSSARAMLHGLLQSDDELSLTWYVRWVHEFLRYWSRDGDPSTKLKIPAQTTHALVLMYSTMFEAWGLDASLECQNLADARVFDNFGVQRPGRSYWFKLTGRR